MLSAVSFDLYQSKILLSANGLKKTEWTRKALNSLSRYIVYFLVSGFICTPYIYNSKNGDSLIRSCVPSVNVNISL